VTVVRLDDLDVVALEGTHEGGQDGEDGVHPGTHVGRMENGDSLRRRAQSCHLGDVEPGRPADKRHAG
jgi:hypothetical protein